MGKLALINQLKEASAERSGGSNFTGTRVPFFTVAPGKTRLLFLSDLEDENSDVPDVKLYRYYPVPGNDPITLNGAKTYEIAYENGDEIHELFKASKRREGKEVKPEYFATKGFAYVINLTGLKAVNFYLQNNKLPTRSDFDGDINEAKAAKGYIENYKNLKKKHEEYRKNVLEGDSDKEDPGDFHYSGVFMYNFPVTITKHISSFVQALIDDGVDAEDISLKEYVFTLSKEGTGKQTSYAFSPDFPASEVDSELLETPLEFVENNELSDFDGLVNRKRNKSEDEELEEEYKVSNVADEDEEEDWDS